MEGEDPATDLESTVNVGIEIEAEGARVVFVPGAAAVTPAVRERLARADVVLFDGTLFADDEMLRAGVGAKTGRRMGHMPIGGPDGSLDALAGLSNRRFFIHINNTNPVLVEGSPERVEVTAAGWQVAEDGMEIEV
jgi:pyrroloquinoline quinone biosynthesis protein B